MLKQLVRTTAVGAALAALAVPAAAQEQGDENRNERARGAPGYYCKQFAEPKTEEFRDCVRLAAKARRQARNGDESGGNSSERASGAPGRFCQANGADPGSEAFRDCVTTAAKARRAAKG